jgi:uncharacterized protein YuzE
MKKFNFSYDAGNDDLFIYLGRKKSSGAIELGNFILDFDEKGDLIAIQVINVSQVFSKILSKMIEVSNIKEIQVEIINFRNMDAVKFKIISEDFEENTNILIPHIKEKSPVLTH